MKKFMLLVATFLASVTGVATPTHAEFNTDKVIYETVKIDYEAVEDHGSAHYGIVHIGDSISAQAWGVPSTYGGAHWASGDVFRSLEYGRDAYSVGLMDLASTASIWPLALSRSEPGGWIIIQDNGNGVSDSAWRTLMEKIRDETPSDRTLIIVLPGYRSDISASLAANMAAKARIMKEVFATELVVFIHLDQYLRRNPAYFPDGQHPNATARTWIKTEIDQWTGATPLYGA